MLSRQAQSGTLVLPANFKRAKIVVQNDSWRSKAGKNEIEVMYNPEALTLDQSAVTQGEGNNVWFSRTQPADLQLKLFFDTYEDLTDVRAKTNDILSLTEPWPSKAGAKVPPTVYFIWADHIFSGIVTQVSQTFTMFLPSGVPVRADLTVTVKEVLTDAQETRAQGLDNCRRLWTVKGSDRLDSIAYRALGDRSKWRLIADANGIYDPIGFPARRWIGVTIAIPDTHGETFEPPGVSDYV